MTGRVIAGAGPARVSVGEPTDVGECRRTARRLAEGYKFDDDDVGKACIVATELATNVLRHGGGGEVLVQILDDGVTAELEILAIDRGPGMRDVAQCMRDGYSTAGTMGTGLGAVSRLSDTFDVFSAPARGTVVMSRITRKEGRSASIAAANGSGQPLEFGAVCIAVAGEFECGDTWRIADGGERCAVLVADGLGHGPLAATAAQAAALSFSARPFDAPGEVLTAMQGSLSGGRGAVAACAQLKVAEARVEYAGIGNIHGALVSRERSRGMVSHNGTLGVAGARPRQFSYEWPAGEIVVMHSDGVSSRWNFNDVPGLHAQHSAVVAAVLYRDLGRKRDDATVVVVRYRA
jgi:anti-sigma regulatory factor (Ser/Thr protein kinase)